MRVFRVLSTGEPTIEHFLSYEAQGRPLPAGASETVQRRWGAVSAFTSVELAAEMAAKYGLGEWYASLELPKGIRVEVGRERPRGGAHVSIYGESGASLLGYVIEVGRLQLPDVGLE
jgi:hypothetical protein